MRHSILTLFLLLSAYIIYARPNEDLLKANYLYIHLAYFEAIKYYQKAAPEANDPETYARLGDCYRLTKDPESANAWYAKAITLNGCPEDVRLHYAQTLMYVGEYASAVPQLKHYLAANTKDKRVVNMITSCEQMEQMKKQILTGSIWLERFNTDRSEFGPALRKNELFFTADTVEKGTAKKDNWTGQPFYKIYSTRCDGSGDCNSEKELLGKTNTKYHDGPCAFNSDGSMMFFTRTNYIHRFFTQSPLPDKNDIVHLEIMIASNYKENDGKYEKVIPFKYNNPNYSTAHPSVSKDGNLLVFVSDMPGGIGGTDIYYCKKNADGSWDTPKSAGEAVNTEGDELFPYLDKDNTLYFSSDGLVGFGGLDIYRSAWDSNTQSFTTPQNMGMPLNSSHDDMSLVWNDEGNLAFFASNRPAEKKGDNIYSFRPQSLYLSVTGIDSLTNSPIPGFDLQLRGVNDTILLTANPNGRIITPLFPACPYTAIASAYNYLTKEFNVGNTNTTKAKDTIHVLVKLRANAAIRYHVMVYDEDSYTPLENPVLVFHKIGSSMADTTYLKTGQFYNAVLEQGNSYQVYAMKDNYYGNEKVVSTQQIKPGTAGVNINDTLLMKKLRIGDVYKIDNVYYDYNKANIREDAKPALNRLISLLQQYPAMKIQINSHTDCRGAAAYNLKLSNARAHAVIIYLQQRGIALSRLNFKGYGATRPVHKCNICGECTEQEHQANRRTEFTIMAM